MKELRDWEVEPLLQIHDEWIFQTGLSLESEDLPRLKPHLRESADATQALGISVPIPCKIAVGLSYGDLHAL
jgi:DNA polymerase I-like protein with 3'-5' exonuclease and polymerase domains